jgi:hypothetical protein
MVVRTHTQSTHIHRHSPTDNSRSNNQCMVVRTHTQSTHIHRHSPTDNSRSNNQAFSLYTTVGTLRRCGNKRLQILRNRLMHLSAIPKQIGLAHHLFRLAENWRPWTQQDSSERKEPHGQNSRSILCIDCTLLKKGRGTALIFIKFCKLSYWRLTAKTRQARMLKLHTCPHMNIIEYNSLVCCTGKSGVCVRAFKYAHNLNTVAIFCCFSIFDAASFQFNSIQFNISLLPFWIHVQR